MEYFCHIWAGAPIYYLDMLDKLQKQVFSPLSLYINTFTKNCHSQTTRSLEQRYPGLGNVFSTLSPSLSLYIYAYNINNIYDREIVTEVMAK